VFSTNNDDIQQLAKTIQNRTSVSVHLCTPRYAEKWEYKYGIVQGSGPVR
jgi:hypothetical protein